MHDDIRHYGTPRHSGRYPWGSGDDAQQRNKSFLGYVDDLKKKGLSEKEIAKGLGISTTVLRAKKSIAKDEQRKADTAQALRLKDKGYSNVAIGERMGINESSVRSLLNPAISERTNMTKTTADMLKRSVDEKEYIDVGVGSERFMGISRSKLKTAVEMLKEEEGYTVHYIPVEQLGTGNKTTVTVLAKPDTTFQEVYRNKDNIKMVTEHSEDGGRSFLGLKKPMMVDSSRVYIRYDEDGGTDSDGTIELRRGVDDISLGNSKYAQVRINVNDNMYMKGMAIYSDDIPDGYDMVYNTNKAKGTPPEKVFKPMVPDMSHPNAKKIKDMDIPETEKEALLKKGVLDKSIPPDPDNPFGASVRQKCDPVTKELTSALNIVNEEGDWGKWSKTLSSQMLSKQTPSLAKKQLSLAYDVKKEEYDEIMSLTNPAVKKKLLDSFADDCDSSAVHLKSAALPRQGAHVILPFPSMKETEIYAPNYRNGEKVVLIRYPHGGIFEIPELTVNNKHPQANKVMKNAIDGVGISSKVAERLSGADFDGDTVLVIPNNDRKIKTSAPLKGLMDFDPKQSYPAYDGMPKMDSRTKQTKMGEVSNLITDMTIKGASASELARAVRHSMVVIDAEKHNLNYKQSAIDNGITALKQKYQGGPRRGASTLISKASSEQRVGTRKESIDPETGKKVYEYTNESYVDRKGKTQLKTTKSTKMYETDDAFKLSSGTPMESVYAEHANKLKALANKSRKDSMSMVSTPYSPSAKKTYASEVGTLNAKLNVALKNAPLERQAMILANSIVKTKLNNNPNMDAASLKKLKGQALAEARTRMGAKKQRIDLTDREWEAIQAGAISPNKLSQILNNTDLDRIKQLATPRKEKPKSAAKQQRARNLLESGHSRAEVADVLGISTSSLDDLLK